MDGFWQLFILHLKMLTEHRVMWKGFYLTFITLKVININYLEDMSVLYMQIPAYFTHQVRVNEEEWSKGTRHPKMVMMVVNHNKSFNEHDNQQECLQ